VIFEPKRRLSRIGIMRTVYIALSFLVVSTLAQADEWNKKYSVSATPELRVHTDDGRVEVHAGSSNEIAAHVTTKGWKISESEVQIVEHQMGNMVDLEVRIPHHHFQAWNNREIRVDLTVPVNMTSNIETGDGAVVIRGVHGDTRVRTGDGSIHAEDTEGRLDLHTGDGSVTVRARVEGLTIETGDGSVTADIESGSHVASGWKIHTGDGSVTVHVPSDLSASLDLHTGDGSVSVDGSISIENVSKDHNTMRGKLNGGGETFRIESGDGSIHVGGS
jgi:DUF4097 and DUF4098 domain-containing protein YvlB